MTCVARRGQGIVLADAWSCQPGATRRPRHDWSMRWLDGSSACPESAPREQNDE